MLIVR
jgi:serine/threonine protein kinase